MLTLTSLQTHTHTHTGPPWLVPYSIPLARRMPVFPITRGGQTWLSSFLALVAFERVSSSLLNHDVINTLD